MLILINSNDKMVEGRYKTGDKEVRRATRYINKGERGGEKERKRSLNDM